MHKTHLNKIIKKKNTQKGPDSTLLTLIHYSLAFWLFFLISRITWQLIESVLRLGDCLKYSRHKIVTSSYGRKCLNEEDSFMWTDLFAGLMAATEGGEGGVRGGGRAVEGHHTAVARKLRRQDRRSGAATKSHCVLLQCRYYLLYPGRLSESRYYPTRS